MAVERRGFVEADEMTHEGFHDGQVCRAAHRLPDDNHARLAQRDGSQDAPRPSADPDRFAPNMPDIKLTRRKDPRSQIGAYHDI